MQYNEILKTLKSQRNPEALEGMSRFGIKTNNSYGISIPQLRTLSKKIGTNHNIAKDLWKSGIKDAMILATMIDDSKMVTEKQMEQWVKNFDSWDVCDQCCNNLFVYTPFAHKKAFEWSEKKEEFIKRAGFVLMATLAVHDKKAKDKTFIKFFPLIIKASTDERNFVKKAVNWALRQIGKRNPNLNKKAIKIAKEIHKSDSKSSVWVATDALRELSGKAVQKKLTSRKS